MTTKRCRTCDKKACTKTCGVCGVYYCSVECQRKGWPKHSLTCAPTQHERYQLFLDAERMGRPTRSFAVFSASSFVSEGPFIGDEGGGTICGVCVKPFSKYRYGDSQIKVILKDNYEVIYYMCDDCFRIGNRLCSTTWKPKKSCHPEVKRWWTVLMCLKKICIWLPTDIRKLIWKRYCCCSHVTIDRRLKSDTFSSIIVIN